MIYILQQRGDLHITAERRFTYYSREVAYILQQIGDLHITAEGDLHITAER